MSRAVVTSGGSRILPCTSQEGLHWLALRKEGDHNVSWILDSMPHPYKQPQPILAPGLHHRAFGPQGTFHLSWTFMCDHYFRKDPQEWSHTSEPMELPGSGDFNFCDLEVLSRGEKYGLKAK
ncbi:Leukocyte immunoglobulin-like receptor subfamily B member 3 [Myotis davidii]|nr:Leukocyte immunoglobulin-like receptor subfamily B member 3 [Myotis davidii]